MQISNSLEKMQNQLPKIRGQKLDKKIKDKNSVYLIYFFSDSFLASIFQRM